MIVLMNKTAAVGAAVAGVIIVVSVLEDRRELHIEPGQYPIIAPAPVFNAVGTTSHMPYPGASVTLTGSAQYARP